MSVELGIVIRAICAAAVGLFFRSLLLSTPNQRVRRDHEREYELQNR